MTIQSIQLLADTDHPSLSDRAFWLEYDAKEWVPLGTSDSWSLSSTTAMPLVWNGKLLPDNMDIIIRATLGRNWWMLEHLHQLSHVIKTGTGWSAVLLRLGRLTRPIEDKLYRLNLPEGVPEEIQSAWALAHVCALLVPNIRVEVIK